MTRTNTDRSGGAKLGLQPFGVPLGVEGKFGGSVELQSAYVLEVGEKSTFSKVLDVLENEEQAALTRLPHPLTGDERWVTSRDQLVELTGTMKLSPVSSVGKIMNVMLQLMGHEDVDLDELFSKSSKAGTTATDIPAQAKEILKSVYLRNEVPEIPTLFTLELADEDTPWTVFVNCDPGYFIGTGAAATDSIEGEVTVVGVVREFVGNDPHDGFISTEPWTLHGWERTMREVLRIQMDELTQKLIPQFDPEWRAGDASFYIKGPAVVVDTVAIF